MIPPQKPKYSLTRHPSWNLLSRYQPTITLFGGLYFCYELIKANRSDWTIIVVTTVTLLVANRVKSSDMVDLVKHANNFFTNRIKTPHEPSLPGINQNDDPLR